MPISKNGFEFRKIEAGAQGHFSPIGGMVGCTYLNDDWTLSPKKLFGLIALARTHNFDTKMLWSAFALMGHAFPLIRSQFWSQMTLATISLCVIVK